MTENNLYVMSESCNGMDRLFPIPEDFQIRMNDLLFIMKYHGKYSFDEVKSLPIVFRERQVELLIKQLQRESGSSVESHAPDLNTNQERELNRENYKEFAEFAWQDMLAKAGESSPLDAQKTPDVNIGRVSAPKQNKPKLKSPF